MFGMGQSAIQGHQLPVNSSFSFLVGENVAGLVRSTLNCYLVILWYQLERRVVGFLLFSLIDVDKLIIRLSTKIFLVSQKKKIFRAHTTRFLFFRRYIFFYKEDNMEAQYFVAPRPIGPAPLRPKPRRSRR
jgi:hypothetical protein